MDPDKKIVFGSTFGVASFRQHVELTPYGNFNYSRFESHLGRELNTYIKILPIIPERAIRWTIFGDGSFDYIGGSAVNIGSRRYALFGRLGASIRFGTMDESELLIRARVGLGPSYNELNFGKGIVPSGTWGLAAQAQVSLSFVHCFSKLLCIGPQIGFGEDFSPGFTSSNIFIGFAGNGLISPPPRNREVDPPPPPAAPPQQIAKCPPVTPPPTPEVPKPQEVVKATPTPPPRCPNAEALTQKIERNESIIHQLETRLQIEARERQAIQERVRHTNSVRYQIAVIPQRMMLFQNDMADIATLKQRFPSNNKASRTKGNPVLDSVIRRVTTWMDNIERLSQGNAKPAYLIELTIRGYANDTGMDDNHNRKLADGRAQAVQNYIEQSKGTYDHYGKNVKNLHPDNIRKIAGQPIVTIRRIPASSAPMDDIKRLLLSGLTGKEKEEQLKQLDSDAKNPDWRLAIIEYRIRKWTGSNYKEIPVEEFSKINSTIMEPGDKK